MKMTEMLLLTAMVAVPIVALAAGRRSAPNISTSSAGMKVKGAMPVSKPVPAFGKVDTNGDHFIEWKEAKAVGVPKATFQSDDYNHDDKLTPTDWKLVQMDMIHTASLPKPESTAMQPVPASVARAVKAPSYATAPSTGVAPPSETGREKHN